MRAILIALFFAIAMPAAAQDAPQSPYRALKEERIRAYRDGDRAYFEKLLAPDFVSLAPDGRRVTRAQYLDSEFHPGAALGTETQVSDFRATRTGDTLILAYEETERTRVGTDVFEVHLGRLDIYMRRHGRWLLQTMSAVRIPQAPREIAVAPERLRDYVGAYVFGPNLVSTVRLQDGALTEQTTGQAETKLVPVAPDTFYAPPDVEARVTFERDARGLVTAQVYTSNGQALRAPRR